MAVRLPGLLLCLWALCLCLAPASVAVAEPAGMADMAGRLRELREELAQPLPGTGPQDTAAAQPSEPPRDAPDDCPEWYRPEKERLASLDFEERAAERRHQTWEAAKTLLFLAFMAFLFYNAFKFGAGPWAVFRSGKFPLTIWTNEDNGAEDLQRQAAAKKKIEKYMMEHPHTKYVVWQEELPLYVKWILRLVRKWKAWGTPAARQDDVPQPGATGTPQATEAANRAVPPQSGATPPPAGQAMEGRYAAWLRQRRLHMNRKS